MIVKCEKCGTGYSIPESVLTDKPRKMRCSRCGNIFTLMRRQEIAPSGYEEYSGSQHLPQEFAFLKEAKKPEPEPEPEHVEVDLGEMEEPAPKEPAPFAVVRPSAPGDASGPRVSSAQIPAPPPAPKRPSAPPAATPAPAAPPPAPAPAAPAPAAPAPAASAPAPAAPAAAPAPAQAPAPAPGRHAWEEETPLELATYALPYETRHRGAQAFGKLVFVLFMLGIAFVLWVSYRNGWTFSISEFGNQISFAFSGRQYEEIADEARDLDVTVSGRKLVAAAGGAQYLIVSGEVVNRGFTGLSRIVLSGKLQDPAGETVAELRAPCGKVLDEGTIARTPKGSMAGHYMEREGLYNCVISYKGSSPFQVVFEDVPAGYEPSYQVQIKAVSAQTAE